MQEPQQPLTSFEAQRTLEELWANQLGERIKQYTYVTLLIVGVILLLIIVFIPAVILLLLVLLAVGVRKGIERIKRGKHKTGYQQSEASADLVVEESAVRYSLSNESVHQFKLNRSKHKADQPWLLALSKEFLKDVAEIDRKLQGRILNAVSDIVSNPMTPKGNTIKALTGNEAGKWRYRIGDFRVIYKPDTEAHVVEIITFVERGAAYSA
jgi:mRNA-degrading endonuclease RelE of RelBE toxin-antitoxin system